ncbi:uncharacterized protein PFL1_02717 [Pseudozyma flocculosa PF-1]|uniref:3'-5' exonuclease n=2 Tax=Pseudozyma flocculosa TaxID=84751 RepID=A0A5C3F163_9BASI|nr:uncharacterized protein PFL1_02717 [Pseudozyma flocculosa PF-1]EPQ29498.1 hypothetical protein PFL1_02717 [Pseudozyma flocculosa PF-1]SPO38032.1 uncharacterized protein PSFLO_03509 [Pseudozyma flocculosa]
MVHSACAHHSFHTVATAAAARIVVSTTLVRRAYPTNATSSGTVMDSVFDSVDADAASSSRTKDRSRQWFVSNGPPPRHRRYDASSATASSTATTGTGTGTGTGTVATRMYPPLPIPIASTSLSEPRSPAASSSSPSSSSLYPPLAGASTSARSAPSASSRPTAAAPRPPPAPPLTSRQKGQSIPKTWSSTAPRRSAPRSYSTYRASSSRANQQREEERTQLEAHLDFYSYKQPVTAALSPGEAFLRRRSHPDPNPDPASSSAAAASVAAPPAPAPSTSHRLRPPAVAYTTDLAESIDLVHCLGPGPLALDMEWNFSHTGKVYKTALLQIASPSLVVLLHLSSIKVLPPPLLALLTDARRIKTGVAIRNDALKLQRDFGVACRGLVELSHVARAVDPSSWEGRRGGLISLRDLTRVYLGRKLRKDAVRTSDWTRTPLDAEQREYATNDVVVSLEILRALVARIDPGEGQGGAEGEGEGEGRQSEQEALVETLMKMARVDVDPVLSSASTTDKATASPTTTTTTRTPSNRKVLKPITLNAVSVRETIVLSSSPSSSSSSSSVSSNSESITLDRIELAHHRAMNLFLAPLSLTLSQIATTLNVKTTTVAAYIYKTLIDPVFWQRPQQQQQRGQGQGQGRGRRLSEEEWKRLDAELERGGRMLASTRSRIQRVRGGWMPDSWSRKAKLGRVGDDQSSSPPPSAAAAAMSAMNKSQPLPSSSSTSTPPARPPPPPPPPTSLHRSEAEWDEVDVVEPSH